VILGLLVLLGVLLAMLAVADREDTGPEGGSDEVSEPSNQYLTKKDLKTLLIGIAILAVVLTPVFLILKGGADHYQCSLNMKAISTAMLGYSTKYDDRLPPLFARAEDSNLPRVDSKGRPFTWASTLVNIAGFDRKRSFRCPTAPANSVAVAEGLDGADLPMTYGMYAGLECAGLRDVEDPGNAIVVAETNNGGAEDSFDPHPIALNGSTVDAFLIGWAGGDLAPEKRTDWDKVTRLAFKQSKNGLNPSNQNGRHDQTINVLFMDGHTGFLKAGQLLGTKHWPAITQP
jgi:prepilin-type processing-associated H-X9-DG protein